MSSRVNDNQGPAGHELPRKSICGIDWQRLGDWPNERIKPSGSLALVDLFAGCGGMSLGVWEAARIEGRSLEIRCAIDFSKEASALYQRNFPRFAESVMNCDITKIFRGAISAAVSPLERTMARRTKTVDLLIGGPPCQGHSDLNNSSRRNDPRNGLYFRMVRAAQVLTPRAIVIENVPAVRHDRGRVVDRATDALSKMGYTVSSAVVDLSTLGLAQSRKRHILLAVKSAVPPIESLLSEYIAAPCPLQDVIGDLCSTDQTNLFNSPSRLSSTNRARVDYLFETGTFDLPNHLRPKCHAEKTHSYVSMYGRLCWDKPAQTITSGFGSMGQGRFIHPELRRTITPHEAARIQGFPDFFSFASVTSRTALQEIIGNAVPPKLTAAITQSLIQHRAI